MHAPSPTEPILKASARDFACDLDLSHEETSYLLELAGHLKASPDRYASALAGRSLSLMFEKPSLRTRLTFELAIKQLGGDSIFSVGMIGEREPIKDVARNLDRWTKAIVARVFSQTTIEELARWANVPVINALSDLYHPCQVLADLQTLRERCGALRGINLTFVGDGNNVAHSLMLSAVRLGKEGEAYVRLTYADALAASGDHGRASEVARVARDRLLAHAAKISDPRWRTSFLELIPENARTLRLG